MTKLHFMELLRTWAIVERLRDDDARHFVSDAKLVYINDTCRIWGGIVYGRTVGFTRYNNFNIRIWGKTIDTKLGFAHVMWHEICHIITEVHNPHKSVVHGHEFWHEMHKFGLSDVSLYSHPDEVGESMDAWLKPDMVPWINGIGEVEGLR